MFRKVLLKLECVTYMQELVLLVFQYVLNDIDHCFLAEVDKTVQNFQCVLVRYQVREEAEEWAAQEGL